MAGVVRAQQQQGGEARPDRRQRRCPTVVGLRPTAGHHRVGTFFSGIGYNKFKFTDFVAGQFAAGEVVPFKKNFHPGLLTEPFHLLQGGGGIGQGKALGAASRSIPMKSISTRV